MADFRGAHDLGELADVLHRVFTTRGRRPRDRGARRGRGQAPTMVEWVAGQGLDLAWLLPAQQDSFRTAFRRCMERALGDAFWDSNHTALYKLPSRGPPPELGVGAQPDEEGDALGRLRSAPPRSFVELAGLLKGAAGKKRAPTEEMYQAASHKKKTGRRTALHSPTLEQWAITCKVPITRLTRPVVAAADRVYLDLLDAYLTPWFGDRSSAPRGQDNPGPKTQGQAQAHGQTQAGTRAHQADLSNWLKAKFSDFDEDYMGHFTSLFPGADAAGVIDLAALWDTKQPDGKYSNFKRFLRRSAAVLAAMKGGLSLPAANDWVFNELNPAYDAVAALVKEKGGGALDPLEFAAEVETMPLLLKTSPPDLRRILDDVRARNVGVDLSTRTTLQQVARRVQMGRGAGVQGDPLQEVVRRAVEGAGADAAERALGITGAAGGDAYSKPGTHFGGGGTDTLHALRHKRFGQQSTRDMIDRAVRMGSEPWAPQGTTWVVPDGHGGGAAANAVTNMDGLVRDVVNQLVHQQAAPPTLQQQKSDRPRGPPRAVFRSYA